ncbi:MAG: response regulator [Archangium sp.]|nr:response regulator [Archangium sp.]
MEDGERQRKAVLVRSLTRVMAIAGGAGFITSLFDSNNKLVVSIGFYVPVWLGAWALHLLTRRGKIVIAAWILTVFFWTIIAVVTLFFGGLQGHNAACFIAVSMLMSVLVNGRAGVAVACVSIVWCGFVAWLDLNHHLPTPLGPTYSPINAWTAVGVAIVFGVLLMNYALASERRTAEERDEALRRSIQSQKMELVGNLASGVAHDFNNLLMVISATSEQLRMSTDDAERRELIRDLDEATTRATLMTRQLLSFGRTNANAALTSLDVSDAARAFGAMLPRLLGSRIKVKLDVIDGFSANANRAGLEQILLNLAVNARDAMPNGGELTIKIHGDEKNVRIDFADSGIGMAPDTLEKIFQPFFTTRATGTGLGLATVKERVTQFSGAISVKSELGKGTTFTVTFPRVAAAANKRASGTHAVVTTSRQQRILLVEDDPRVRRSLAGLLEHEGFEVVSVSNGAEALQLLSVPHTFACVVSDISMPVMDGDALAKKLETVAPGLPMVLMSGNRAPADLTLDAQRRVFIEKPATREALLEAVDRVLGSVAGEALDRT